MNTRVAVFIGTGFAFAALALAGPVEAAGHGGAATAGHSGVGTSTSAPGAVRTASAAFQQPTKLAADQNRGIDPGSTASSTSGTTGTTVPSAVSAMQTPLLGPPPSAAEIHILGQVMSEQPATTPDIILPYD